MKVNIQYSIELDEIPNKVREFIAEACQKGDSIQAGLKYTASLMDDDSSIEGQLENIDKVRRRLTDIDIILLDCTEILHGYQKALVQLREPQVPQTNLMEENYDDETRNEEIEEG
jgi:hypothetical protein